MGCGASTASASKLPVQSNVPQAQHQMGDAPALPPPPPGVQSGSLVIFEGAEYTVQYITSKGKCDLRSGATGDVIYGIGKEEVTAVHAELASADSGGAPTGHTAEDSTAAAPAPASPALASPAPAAPAPAAPAPAAPPGPALELGESLAKPGGSGARVHKCCLDLAPGEELAVKLLPRSARPDQLEVLVAEAALCQSLHHDSIVRFVLCAASLDIGGAAHCAIVMELLPVSLEDLIVKRAAAQGVASTEGGSSSTPHGAPFGLAALASVATQLAAALSYLHTGFGGPPLLHRDVKPANVFFEAAAGVALDKELADDRSTPDDASAGRLRLGDFDVGTRAESPLVEFVGTPSVSTPPEMWAHEPHHTPADMWALGLTLQWCLALSDPLAEATMQDLEERLCAKPSPRIPIFDDDVASAPWPATLQPIASLARQCCCAEPAARLKAEAVSEALAKAADEVREA